MTSDELEKLLMEYRPSAKLYVTVDGQKLMDTTVVELILQLRESTRLHEKNRLSNVFMFGKQPTILRERRGDVSLGLSAQAEMKFHAPYSDEWLELECR